jgi:hypothetical protein
MRLDRFSGCVTASKEDPIDDERANWSRAARPMNFMNIVNVVRGLSGERVIFSYLLSTLKRVELPMRDACQCLCHFCHAACEHCSIEYFEEFLLRHRQL